MYALILFIVGLFLIFFGILENSEYQIKKEYNWSLVYGKILESIIESRNKNKDNLIISKFKNKYFFTNKLSNNIKEYRLRLKYQYYVNNKVYYGTFIEENSPNHWSLYDTVAKQNQLLYHEGKIVPVYFQPDNPQNSFLDLTPQKFNFFYLIIGILFIIPYLTSFF